MANNDSMNDVTPNPSPLGDLNPADLLRQGAADETRVEGDGQLFEPPSLEEIGAIFPQFEILELIGRGGMGAVYKVRQRELNRIAALKVLPQKIGADPSFAGQFAREAKALAQLNHPNIVTLYEFGQTQGLYYILMEYVDGLNLRQLMQSGRLFPREALAIVPQICDALQYAHDRKIIHRDIKPENILLDRQGHVKVADFGLVKLVADAQTASPGVAVTSGAAHETLLMRDGKVMGTPAYMAPEQRETPSAVDHRADIYALGVVFYQMLTGELPGKPLEIPSRKVQLDVRLDEVVLRALEKNPERRYAQASMMKTCVAEATTGVMAAGAVTRGERMYWGRIGVVAATFTLCAVTMLAVTSWLLKNIAETPSPPTTQVMPTPPAEKSETPVEDFLRTLPDGITLVSSAALPREKIAESEKMFGVKIERMGNSVISLDRRKIFPVRTNAQIAGARYQGSPASGNMLQIHTIHAADDAAAQVIFEQLRKRYGENLSPYAVRQGRMVVEYRFAERSYLPPSDLIRISLLLGFYSPEEALFAEDVVEAKNRARRGSSSLTSEFLTSLPLGGRDIQISRNEVAEFEKMIGGKIDSIRNHQFSVHEKELQINVINAADEANAQKILDALVIKFGDNPPSALRDGKKVIEYHALAKEIPAHVAIDALRQFRLIEYKTAETILNTRYPGKQPIALTIVDWLELIDGGRYRTSFAMLPEENRVALSKELNWPQKFITERKELGAVTSRKFKSLENVKGYYTETAEGFRYIRDFQRMRFETDFSNKKNVIEVIDFRESSGYWTPIGYTFQTEKSDGTNATVTSKSAVTEVTPLVQQAREWLALSDGGKYRESYAGFAAFAKGQMTEANYVSAMTVVRTPLGNVVSRKLKTAEPKRSLAGMPDGEYLVLVFETEFAAKKNAFETVTLSKTSDGAWKIAGYFIQ